MSDQPKNSENKVKGGKKTRRWLSVLLVLVMLAELGIAAFKYPGFLIKEPGTEQPWDSLFKTSSGGTSDADNGDAVTKLTGELALRYSKGMLESAKEYTADISWTESDVTLGDVTVRMEEWHLDQETDKLSVKELPEIAEGKEGWAIKAYDISLESGQKTFSSDVSITIPRDRTAAFGGCVWYDEAADVWRDVYSEVSADGNYYILYADHFSLFGEKKYIFDAGNLTLKEADGLNINLSNGVFAEVVSGGDPMMRKVKIDYRRMWNLFTEKTEKDVAEADKVVKLVSGGTADMAAWREAGSIANTTNNALGYFGAGDNANSAALNLIYKAPVVGNILGSLDIALTSLKIVAEAKGGNKAYGDVLMDHIPDLLSAGVSGLGLLFSSSPPGWLIALAGVLVWTGSKIYDDYVAAQWFNKQVMNPSLEQLYQNYYFLNNVVIDFGSETTADHYGDYHFATMEVLPTAIDDPEEQSALTAALEKNGGLMIKIVEDDKKTKNSHWVYRGWVDIFTAILRLYGNDPELLSQALDDLYYDYANVFWRLPKEQQNQFIKDTVKDPNNKYYANGMPDLSYKDTKKITEAFIANIKVATLPQLRAAAEKLQREMCEELIQEMETRLLPILNSELVFHVKDENVTGDFEKSPYCVDWTTIKENKAFAAGGAGIRYDSEDLITPMRFEKVENPLFFPLLPADTMDPSEPSLNRADRYYPYRPDFLPKAGKDDVVFRCTYYHYIMMGSPQSMMFKKVSNPADYKMTTGVSVPFTVPEIKEGTACTDILITIPKKGVEYCFSNLDEMGSTSDEAYHALWLMEKGLEGKTLTLDQKGKFSLSGYAEYSVDGEKNTQLSLLGPGEDGYTIKWTQYSYTESFSFTIEGTYDQKTNTGTASVTGSFTRNSTNVVCSSNGKKENIYTTTGKHTGTLSGKTNNVSEINYESGDSLNINFWFTEGESGKRAYDLSFSYQTTYSDGDVSNETNNPTLYITFKKK